MSRNISKEKRDTLIAKIGMIHEYIATAPQDDKTGALLTYLCELEKEIKSKKYGLVFEEHLEKIDETLAENVPVLIEEHDLFINNAGQMNFLIEGDNLAALNILLKTHRKKIDLIYIDPPYNRGKNDFRYDDNYVNADDAFKHSKWSSFMTKRLILAKQLLSEDGVIFIHIDDNEQSTLRMICDEIFGENNFVGTIIQNKLNSKNDSSEIQKNHEFIHVYRRMIRTDESGKPRRLLSRIDWLEKKLKKNENGYYYLNDFITTRGEGGILINRLNLGQTVYYNSKTGDFFPEHDYDPIKAQQSDDEEFVYTTIEKHIEQGYDIIRPPKVRGKLGVWTWEKDKMLRDSNLLEIVPVRGRGYSIKSRTYVPEEYVHECNGDFFYRGAFENNIKSIIEFSTNDGTNTLTDVMGVAGTFDNPKNLEMLMYLIKRLRKKNPIILDFFAGSGTTGQAVMELNAEDKEQRRFILCTNNENDICREVTYNRIKNSFDKEKYQASLKFFKIGFVSSKDRIYYDYAPELLDHVRELVELENGVNFSTNMENAIVLTDEEADLFTNNIEMITKCKRLFIGHDVLLSAEQEEILKSLNIICMIVPDYYYRELESYQ